jgi:hypothetical protein
VKEKRASYPHHAILARAMGFGCYEAQFVLHICALEI